MTTSPPNPYLSTALCALQAGVSVVPPRQDGSKRPVGAWKHFQQERPDEEQVRAWYTNGRTGVGVVLGVVSGGLEMFEFDAPMMDEFIAAAVRAGLRELVARIAAGYSEITPGGGVHWFYRCAEVGGNTKLARRPEPTPTNHHGVKVLIETRGDGGFGIVAPSNGAVHPSGRAYELHSGGWDSIVTITPEEREALFDLARSFDQMPRSLPVAEAIAPPSADSYVGDKPGTRFNQQTTWAEVLEPHGWRVVYTHDGVTYWRRPGKDSGISASTGYGGSDLLYVFSTSTVFDAERSYDRFGAYAVLEHGGDFRAAGRALVQSAPGGNLKVGGKSIDELVAAHDTPTVDEETGEVIPPQRRYEIVPAPTFVLRPPQRWLVSGMIAERSLTAFAGQPESYKSFVAIEYGMAIACGRPFLGRRCKRGKVLYICAEGQGGFSRRLLAWQKARMTPLPDTFMVLANAVPLLDNEAVAELVLAARDLSDTYHAIIIDTLAQSIPGANENASETMTGVVAAGQALMAAFDCAVTLIHHGNRAGGMLRGHSSLDGALDTVIDISADRDAGIVTIAPGKQKDGERFPKVYLRRVVVDLLDVLPPPPDLEPDEEWRPSSVVLDPLSDHEQQIRRGEVAARALTAGQRLALRALWEAGGAEGVGHGPWWARCRELGYKTDHRQKFRAQQEALVNKGLVVIRAGSDSERYVPIDITPQLLASFNETAGMEEESPDGG